MPSLPKYNVPKRKKTRALNALAIAERQTPVHPKLKSNRLGGIKQASTKLKWAEPDDLKQEELRPMVKKMHETSKQRAENEVDIIDDCDGNAGVNGQASINDDSDIESDMAMGESDEERFEGFTFRGSSTSNLYQKKSTQSWESNLENTGLESTEVPGRRDEEEFSNDSADGALELVALLDSAEKGDGASSLHNGSLEGNSQRNKFALITNESILDTASSVDSEDSILLVSDNEGETLNSAKLESLKALVSSTNTRSSATTRHHDSIVDTCSSTNPSEFGISSTKKLTIADLFPSVTDPNLKRSLKLLTNDDILSSKRKNVPVKLTVPLTRRERDRLDRAAAYVKSKETLNRWIETVKHNRRAEHLSFPLKDLDAVSVCGTQRSLSKIQPQQFTDLEIAIQGILVNSGLAPAKSGSDDDRAFEELPNNQLSLEEFQARRAALRRTRELLFREETRARRIKKIKSKSYRRVHRKEREKNAQHEKNALAAAGLDNSESEQERSNRRRAEERMGSRHRESKWARGVKDSGRVAWDEETRTGVIEMARRGQELRRRTDGKEAVAGENSSIYSNSDSEDETEDENMETLTRGDISHETFDASGFGIKSNLSSLKFMINAEALRKARNDTEELLLRRQSATEPPESESEIDSPVRRSYGPANAQSPSAKDFDSREQRNELEEAAGLESDEESFHGFALEDDQEMLLEKAHTDEQSFSRNKAKVTGGIADINDGSGNNLSLGFTENPWLETNGSWKVSSRNAQNAQRTVFVSSNLILEDIAAHRDKSEPHSVSKLRTTEKASKIVQHTEALSLGQNFGSADDDEDSNIPTPFTRNQDLVREAFAGDEVVADFIEEKEGIMREEEEKIIDATLPGWGSWTGAGISRKQDRRNRGKVLVKVGGIPKGNRQDAKLDRVIINEKRIRKVGCATGREMSVLQLLTVPECKIPGFESPT